MPRRLRPRQLRSASLQSLLAGVAGRRRPKTPAWFALSPALPCTPQSLPLLPDPMLVGLEALPPSDGRCSPANPFLTWWFRPALASPSSFPDSAAMGSLNFRPGRDPCSACRCWQRRRLRVSLSSLEALPRPSAAPLFELRGNPRSGSLRPDSDDV